MLELMAYTSSEGSAEIAHLVAYTREGVPKNKFSYFSTKTYVVGTQKNHLNESQ